MQRQLSTLLVLLCCFLPGSQTNRIYVHPFSLFAVENVTCAAPHTQHPKPGETHPVAPLDLEVLTPDSRASGEPDAQRQDISVKMLVLSGLLNPLGLRMYQALSSRQRGTNTLMSPVSTYGSLVIFSLGASENTTDSFQFLLGLTSSTKQDDCALSVGRHNVLKTLQSINALANRGPTHRVTTQLWAFTRQDAELSDDFIQGTKDFSDSSFVRSVDLSKAEEAKQLVNNFVEKTSNGKVKSIFRDLNSSSDFLFVSSFIFQGNWRTAFQPDSTSLQEFHVDETTTVMAPLMTRTAQYHYLNDKVRRCTVVKLPLGQESYMLLVLPHEGVNLHDIESKLTLSADIILAWNQKLQKGLLELSVPKFSVSSVTDVRNLLTYMDPQLGTELLAAFSQLSNRNPFTIDKAFNRVVFEMSEEGEPQDNAQEEGIPLKLAFSRPFLFMVIEGGTNAILMLGKITNPML
ncbi:angiotensinogen [Betta splendens]|uniref:Angiotensinogen n=1 Tax=Betta splendens TaxID=158456 RepID=A0A6P7PQJ4_BETSP|nr:angiotensinogen [Betta splendens]XP_029030735.1 angiotensinogen [Betta splendens]XP_029030736.1 angiotensinogen [Betta splendens]XP_055358517.1 angiotensinogen [Betta splendens]